MSNCSDCNYIDCNCDLEIKNHYKQDSNYKKYDKINTCECCKYNIDKNDEMYIYCT